MIRHIRNYEKCFQFSKSASSEDDYRNTNQPTNKQKQGKNPTILETTWKQTNKITETSKFSHNNSIFKQSKPSKEKMQIN